MVLNNKAQMFSVWFPSDFFYQEVTEKWTPFVEKMKLPYTNVVDFMNAQIESISYPSIEIGSAKQQQGQFEIEYTSAKELEAIVPKDFTLTMKLTESYLSYFIMYDQIKWYLEYRKKYTGHVVFMNDINLSFLSESGLGLVNFVYRYVIPKTLGEINLSYAAQAVTNNTFTIGLHYNRMDIY